MCSFDPLKALGQPLFVLHVSTIALRWAQKKIAVSTHVSRSEQISKIQQEVYIQGCMKRTETTLSADKSERENDNSLLYSQRKHETSNNLHREKIVVTKFCRCEGPAKIVTNCAFSYKITNVISCRFPSFNFRRQMLDASAFVLSSFSMREIEGGKHDGQTR